MVHRAGVEPTQLMLPEAVCMTQLPAYQGIGFASSSYQEVEQPDTAYADFSMLHPVPYQVW